MASLDERIEEEVAALGDLTREDLVARWIKAYGCPPPKGVKRGLLERAAAWHLQARHFGGLSPAARKAIRDAVKLGNSVGDASPKLADGDDAAGATRSGETANATLRGDRPLVQPPALRLGTRLVREWNGRTHVVDVNGMALSSTARRIASLSAIAKRITGAHWSGPRFFGL